MPAKRHNYEQDPQKYIDAIVSSTSIKQVLLKLGFTGLDYAPIRHAMAMSGAKLLPVVPKTPPAYYGPYYGGWSNSGYIVFPKTKQKMTLSKAKFLGIVKSC